MIYPGLLYFHDPRYGYRLAPIAFVLSIGYGFLEDPYSALSIKTPSKQL